jgi:predicted transcriptional regulator
MAKHPQQDLSRRERQIMDVLYRLGRAGVAEVQDELPEAPGYSAVRAMLGKLELKGYVRHRQEGARYVYEPKVARKAASEGAVKRVVRTFFDGSTAKAVAAILDLSSQELTEAELAALAEQIEEARRKGR